MIFGAGTFLWVGKYSLTEKKENLPCAIPTPSQLYCSNFQPTDRNQMQANLHNAGVN